MKCHAADCIHWFYFKICIKFFDLLQFEQFVIGPVHAAFSFDGLVTSHPVYVPVYNPDEINEIFDAISYDKVNTLNS